MLSCPPIKRNPGIRKEGSMSFSGVSTRTCTHTQPSVWWMATVVGCCCGGGGSSVNEVHSFCSQLAPEERQWGGKLNLKEGKLCQQVTEACFDQTHSEVRRSHITGPIWRQYYALHRSAFFTQPVTARRRALLPLQIWIKHRPFVAWIYRCWNVGRVKKKQSSTLTYSQSGKLRHKTGKCERSFDAWCVRMNKNAEGMKLMRLTDLSVCDLINRSHANSH